MIAEVLRPHIFAYCTALALIRMLNRRLGNASRPLLVFFRLLIVDQHLSILVIPTGLFLCNADDGEDRLSLLENTVHFLERSIRGFGIEEVDDGEDKGISKAKLVCEMVAK